MLKLPPIAVPGTDGGWAGLRIADGHIRPGPPSAAVREQDPSGKFAGRLVGRSYNQKERPRCRPAAGAATAESPTQLFVVAGWPQPLRMEVPARTRRTRPSLYQPPSMPIAWPVTKAAWSEARKAIIAATSSGVPKRPIGIALARSAKPISRS